VCMNCVVQTVEQGAAAGSASGAIALLATGLSALGLRGLANRLTAAGFDWITPRRVTAATVMVVIVVAVFVAQLTADSASPY
jgi:hypothetical protein